MTNGASRTDPEDPAPDPDATADAALVKAYRRHPIDSDLVHSAVRLAAVTAPEW